MASTATRTPRSSPRLRSMALAPGHDVPDAVGEDGVREHGRRAGAVADGVAGALRRLPDHLGAEVLGRVLERDLLGDGDAVVADERRAKAPLDQHALGLGAERHAHGVGERRRAAQDLLASLGPEQDLFVGHWSCPPQWRSAVLTSRFSLPNDLAGQTVPGGGYGPETREGNASPAALACAVSAGAQPRLGPRRFPLSRIALGRPGAPGCRRLPGGRHPRSVRQALGPRVPRAPPRSLPPCAGAEIVRHAGRRVALLARHGSRFVACFA